MNFALRVPDYYKDDINNLKGDTSINQFIVNAIAEKISALKCTSLQHFSASQNKLFPSALGKIGPVLILRF